MMLVGCGKAEESGSKNEVSAEPTKVVEATATPTVAPSEKPTATPNLDKFEAPTQEGSTVVINPDGSVATPDPNKVMPDLSEFEEGAYISEDGVEVLLKHEDGSIEVLWTPYEVDTSIDAPEVEVDFSIPTEISKDSECVAIVDANGEIIESLDSTDEDYKKVYASVYGYEKEFLCDVTIDTRDAYERMNKYLADDYKYTAAEIQGKVDKYGEKTTYNEKFDVFTVTKVYFNNDKTYCRVKNSKEVCSDETGTFISDGNKDLIFDLKLENGKWLICSPDGVPAELVKILPIED